MKMGRSIHAIGSTDLSWYELSCLVKGIWPEMHTSRELIPGAALLEPATRVAAMAADAVRGANWQRARDDSLAPPTPVVHVLEPRIVPDEDKPKQREPMTAERAAEIRAELARLRKVAKPAD